MMVLSGKPVCGGVAFGKIVVFRRKENLILRTQIQDTQAEQGRLETAKERAHRELGELYEKALTEADEESAQIFDIHQMMIEDDDYLDSIREIISTQRVNAEFAVASTAENFVAMFSAMDDDYMKARAADVEDISKRLIEDLAGGISEPFSIEEPSILIADDLSPSETVQLDKKHVLSFVTELGSTTSHTAILSRVMNIPAIVSVGKLPLDGLDGKDAIVDGETGVLYVSPDSDTVQIMTAKAEELKKRKERLEKLIGKENITIDGKHIDIFANIGEIQDIDAVLRNDAGGVGLFRSEFLFLQADDYPTEEAQFLAYKTAAEKLGGKKIVIRTLDIGADKQVGYFGLDKEENPAMGYRAIRISLDHPELFTAQLRALYRASAFGNIAIMFPMITSVEEVIEIKSVISEVKARLTEENVKYSDKVEIGIMIETPAAAVISDVLAKEVDFFSVGTNDLTQYTLALDRQNPKLDRYYKPHHPALMRLLKLIAENARKAGIWVGICGELASDADLTGFFLAIGIDELSVSPGKVIQIREKVRETDTAMVDIDSFL
jgi:phosphotransferase system enzyme I (PtsI)